MTTLHEDRERALSFGAAARTYDEARPTYPTALIDDLMRASPRRVIDVGCGTGKAGRLFAARGCAVLGVEPDSRMAAVARTNGLTVEEATFEAWDADDRTFDLLVSGQAWHWVEPVAGAVKAAKVVAPGGTVAVFWNLGAHEPAVLAAFEPIYARLAPEIAPTTSALRMSPDDLRDRSGLFAGTPGFGPPEARAYVWSDVFPRDRWIAFLETHSDHARLPVAQRGALLDAVAETIDRLGGVVRFHFTTVTVLVPRTG